MRSHETAESLTSHGRYRRFRRTLFLVMLTISLLPLLTTVGLSFHQYRSLLQKEEEAQLAWNAESAKKTIEAFLEELQGMIVFVAADYTPEELTSQRKLDHVLTNLRKRHKGIVDLSVIDSEGVQQGYAGPYNLKGKYYGDRSWFQATIARRAYISNVFLGYRKLPHFVIAAGKELPQGGGYWVVRVSIDSETLDKFIATINSEASDDIFLIDDTGELQTSSRYYGSTRGKTPSFFTPKKTGITLHINPENNNMMASCYIEGTPWILVLSKKGYIYGRNWSAFRNQTILIVISSAILVLLVIIRTTNLLVNRIFETDRRRETILSEVEHTSKLASIGRLAAGVAHEINNPLAIVNEKAGLMKDIIDAGDEFPNKGKFLHQINGVLDAVNRCKIITHRLLGFARRMDVAREPVRINDLLQEVISFVDKEALYRGIRLRIELAANLPVINSDRGQLQQVFLNIINNAIEAVEQDGLIVISSRLKDRQNIAVVIQDNGPGISAETIKHIFEPFFTTKTNGAHKGTGLGLSITYGLVKKLGGEIVVDSSVGTGTTFTVTLPLEAKLTGREENEDS
ncbi:MAG: hypothetical protein A2521_16455 [Deltaproteobacteria bacterium RIFOXYD12_FULL_57_12]|nr:MAG: hypothetical protein A2521_16455 [Deltaproteobacteria bacterium RIFOXYD12_FULL_57_12]